MALTLTRIVPMWEVFDLPKAIAFYRDVLEFELAAGDDSWWCMLKHGDITIMLNTAYENDKGPAVPDAAEPKAMHYGFLEVTTKDPDGFVLHFLCPASK